ncbi:MAG: hypothetical protein IK012_07430 [Fibrobacter sp.]|uniref:hypothetical protein n=1 Tax=Fibrobacter sp. TaxID=35828 RepID=UPI0025BDEF76|nr:hypothetical protein [Fibrobacter sp.]MBR4785067.1 hypothetical protein [Fibrobacter sp.]
MTLYKGMTVNERLFLSGRMDEFDALVRAKDVNGLKALLKDVEITDESSMRAIIESLGLEYMPRQKETRCAKRKWIRILFLLAPLCLVVLLATLSNCLSNFWMILKDPTYIIPKESNIFQFEVNQMNEGSGDWWIYGQDNKNYYFFYGLESLPYITFSKNDARACSNFDKLNINTWCGKFAEQIKVRDTTVAYAELLDDGCGVLLYRSNYPDLLFFVRLSDSSLYEVDSIVDFYEDFTVYQSETDWKKNRRDVLKKMYEDIMGYQSETDSKKMDDGDRLRKMIDYGMIVDPIMNRFAGELFIVDDDGIYELSLSRRTFKRVIHYHMALDIFETCSDSMIWRLPNPQKSISSSAIRVSFQDSSFFELTPNGTLNIQVVDSNSCLKVKGEYNQVHYDYAEGKKCNARIPLCEPF